MQTLRRILFKQLLKMSKRHSALIEVLRPLHDIEAVRTFHKLIHPPECTVLFLPVRTAIPERDHIHGLPRRIAAVLHDLLSQECRHTCDILHQPLRVLEHLMVHPLQDISAGGLRFQTTRQKIGIVDMSISMGFDVLRLPVYRKLI